MLGFPSKFRHLSLAATVIMMTAPMLTRPLLITAVKKG